MEVLKELPKSGLDALRNKFLLREHVGGLTEEEFEEVLLGVCASHKQVTAPTNATVRRVFASIDILGLGRISWDAFSMYAIDSLRQRGYHPLTGREAEAEVEEAPFHPYHVEQLMRKVHAGCVQEMRVLPTLGKVMVVTTASGGRCSMNLCEMAQNLPLFGIIRLESGQPLAWDFIPQTAGGGSCNSVVCSYNGGVVQLFSTARKSYTHRYLDKSWQMPLSDTQSALHWVPSINRLAMGSRRGLVTLWDMKDRSPVLRKRLTRQYITSIQSQKQLLYVASLDSREAVRCLDLEQNAVMYTFSDHSIGGATQLLVDDEFLFSIGFEHGIVQRPLALPRSEPVILCDPSLPHQGGITTLQRLSGTPLLVSGDVKGNLKFWDLRMGNCVQSIRGRKAFRGSDSHTLPDIQYGAAVYSAAPVRSICYLEFFGKLTVATAKELLVLTADASLCPALVDDSHICRSVFFPNPEFFLTVHILSVKLWCITTGALVRCSEPNITRFEVTSCCLVEPHNQQLLLGTMGGELKAFSVSLLQLTVNLTPAVQPYIHGAEVTALHPVAGYRGERIPYVLVGTTSTVLLAPVYPDCGPEAVINFQGIVRSFMPWKQTIRAVAVTESYFILATSDARVHCVNYRGIVSLTHTFHMSVDVEAIVAVPALMLRRPQKGMTLKELQFNEVMIFCVDVVGRVHIATMRQGPPRTRGRHATGQCGERHPQFFGEMIGSWLSHKPGSWVEGEVVEVLRQQDLGRFPLQKRSSVVLNCKGGLSHSMRSELGGGTLGMPALDTVTGCAVSIVLLEQYSVLVTADDEGTVRLWDVGSAVAHCLDEGVADAPVLITVWRRIDREVIFFGAAKHPTLNLPLLFTATNDLQVTLWSADGYALGTLSTGREVDEASGGRRFGLVPYRLLSADTTEALWANFLAYMEQAHAADAQRVSRLRTRRCSTVAPNVLHWEDASMGQPPSQANFLLGRRVSRSSVILPQLGPTASAAFCCTSKEGVCTHSTFTHRDKEKIDDPEEPGSSIVKPSYQRLITRTVAPFSLRRTGGAFLPH
ncbi:hypothetical protein TraAM80_02044 [Trypanosoma rangeli]|uniref:Uncharacterized protein n=1 Tax=Trypanosoma rangeli TaxID=5698 RepID=A0A422NW71_TRYRA|nr:uncharacterized protein TraAM80_02044 [Trypanosoma rangeli]RNF09689.1 hypothetical protein TraAM80_02044 [Trypanosoma rangeli]|eukprot:RNF09689.1 hypothetical protein TraAM80_02044 [Trypanosoma rangeli]